MRKRRLLTLTIVLAIAILLSRFCSRSTGPATAAAAKGAGIRVDIMAQEHTIPGLVAAMESYFKKGEEVEP